MKTPTVSSLLRAITVLCLGLLALPSAGRAQASKPGWGVDVAQALAKAKADRKMVLLDFTGSDWCGWCMKMDREIYATPEFQTYAQANLELVELDFPKKKQLPPATKQQNDALARQCGVSGFPTTALLNSDGKVLKMLDGYQSGGAAAFIATLEKARSGGVATSQAITVAPTTAAKPAYVNPLGDSHVQGSSGL